MSLPFLSDSSFVSRIILDSWRAYCGHWASRHRLMADCHPHSTLGSRICHGLPRPISARHLVCSPFPQTCSPVLGSYQVLADLKIAWFASPISARHLVCSPFPQTCSPVLGSYQVLAHLKIAWFASSHLLPLPHLLTLPTQGSSTWMSGWGVDSWMVWVLIECELPVTSPHHAPHAAWLALGVFLPSLFFLCVFFLVLFFGGLGGRKSWLGSRPPSCHHR